MPSLIKFIGGTYFYDTKVTAGQRCQKEKIKTEYLSIIRENFRHAGCKTHG